MNDFFFICATVRLTAPNLSVLNKKTFVNKTIVLLIYVILKQTDNKIQYNCGTIKLDRDFSNDIVNLIIFDFIMLSACAAYI